MSLKTWSWEKKNYRTSRFCRHKIMKHFKILVWFDSPQVKWCMKSRIKNIVHEVPNDLRFGNYAKKSTIF